MAYRKSDYLLSSDENSNYRSIRAIAWLFIVKGLFYLWCAYVLLPENSFEYDRRYSPYIEILILVWGIMGVVGGIVTLYGERKVSVLMYACAIAFLLAFPLGTLLSMVMLRGIGKYLQSVEKLQNDPTAQFDSLIKARKGY